MIILRLLWKKINMRNLHYALHGGDNIIRTFSLYYILFFKMIYYVIFYHVLFSFLTLPTFFQNKYLRRNSSEAASSILQSYSSIFFFFLFSSSFSFLITRYAPIIPTSKRLVPATINACIVLFPIGAIESLVFSLVSSV